MTTEPSASDTAALTLDQLLERLPEAWRDVVREKFGAHGDREAARYRLVPPDALTGVILANVLVSDPAAADFVLTNLPVLPHAKDRRASIEYMGNFPHWREHAGLPALLDALVRDDEDETVVVEALEARRLLAARRGYMALHERLSRAREAGAETPLILEEAELRWAILSRGGLLPDFVQRPPAVFTVSPANQAATNGTLRVVAFGDTGAINGASTPVPDALVRYADEHPLSLGLVLGDTFHPQPERADDPVFERLWEARYGRLGVPFYAVLGNKDWHGRHCAEAQLAYGCRSATWRMPALSYSFIAGPVQFFALGHPALGSTLRWLDRAIADSTSAWKVVFGHHPLESRGSVELAGLLRGRADAYFASYARLEHSEPLPDLQQFISGTAGAKSCKWACPGTRSRSSRPTCPGSPCSMRTTTR